MHFDLDMHLDTACHPRVGKDGDGRGDGGGVGRARDGTSDTCLATSRIGHGSPGHPGSSAPRALTRRQRRVATWLAIASALTLTLEAATVFLPHPMLSEGLGALALLNGALLAYLLATLRRLVVSRFRSHSVDRPASILIAAIVVFAIAGPVGGLVESRAGPESHLVDAIYGLGVATILIRGIAYLIFGRRLLRLPGQLFGCRAAFGNAVVVAGWGFVPVIFFPVGILAEALACAILSVLFLRSGDPPWNARETTMDRPVDRPAREAATDGLGLRALSPERLGMLAGLIALSVGLLALADVVRLGLGVGTVIFGGVMLLIAVGLLGPGVIEPQRRAWRWLLVAASIPVIPLAVLPVGRVTGFIRAPSVSASSRSPDGRAEVHVLETKMLFKRHFHVQLRSASSRPFWRNVYSSPDLEIPPDRFVWSRDGHRVLLLGTRFHRVGREACLSTGEFVYLLADVRTGSVRHPVSIDDLTGIDFGVVFRPGQARPRAGSAELLCEAGVADH